MCSHRRTLYVGTSRFSTLETLIQPQIMYPLCGLDKAGIMQLHHFSFLIGKLLRYKHNTHFLYVVANYVDSMLVYIVGDTLSNVLFNPKSCSCSQSVHYFVI